MYEFLLFSNKHVSETIGNTVPKAQSSLRTIISTVQISLGLSDTPLTVGCLQIFSVIRGLSSSRKSEKRVFYDIVWTSVVYFILLNCTHREHVGVPKTQLNQLYPTLAKTSKK